MECIAHLGQCDNDSEGHREEEEKLLNGLAKANHVPLPFGSDDSRDGRQSTCTIVRYKFDLIKSDKGCHPATAGDVQRHLVTIRYGEAISLSSSTGPTRFGLVLEVAGVVNVTTS